jgi:hypothetical protein
MRQMSSAKGHERNRACASIDPQHQKIVNPEGVHWSLPWVRQGSAKVAKVARQSPNLGPFNPQVF